MAKYRKKPIVIEAIQISELLEMFNSGKESLMDMIPQWVIDNINEKILTVTNDHIEIKMLEEIMRGDSNDYLIQEPQKEIYVCKSDIFKETYEKVDENKK